MIDIILHVATAANVCCDGRYSLYVAEITRMFYMLMRCTSCDSL